MIAWLIECGSPADYWCAPGDWCSNPNHAHKFATEAEAKAVTVGMRTMEPVRVCEHQWTDRIAEAEETDYVALANEAGEEVEGPDWAANAVNKPWSPNE